MLPTPALSPAMSPTPDTGEGYHCAEARDMDEDLPKKSVFSSKNWISDPTLEDYNYNGQDFCKILQLKPGQTFTSRGGSEGRP